eukprot:m.28985 g.28985  ORF g.28985 m.28985 type:complete len:323 (-) comp11908_c0_seq1:28-996(-)
MADLSGLPGGCKILQGPGDIQVILLGTAHISKQSVDDVINIINTIKPAMVTVEICPERQAMLAMDYTRPLQQTGEVGFTALVEAITSGTTESAMQTALSDLYAGLCETLQLEVPPGAEFAAAFQLAKQYGASVCLADRPVSITLKRVWQALSWWERIKLLWVFAHEDFNDITEADIEDMRNNSDLMTEAFAALATELPAVMAPLIHERDMYLTYQIKNSCALLSQLVYLTAQNQQGPELIQPELQMSHQVFSGPGQRVVLAVVGAGHIPGIENQWDQELSEMDVHRISSVPMSKPFPWLWYTSITVTVGALGWLGYKRLVHK